MRTSLKKTIIILLLFANFMTSVAFANDYESNEKQGQTKSNAYIQTCSGRISPRGNGRFNIIFTVAGTGLMDQIGAMTIQIYKNNALVDIFRYTYSGRSNMMGYNISAWSDIESYQGVSGATYYAKITFYAKNSNGNGYVYYTTTSVTI